MNVKQYWPETVGKSLDFLKYWPVTAFYSHQQMLKFSQTMKYSHKQVYSCQQMYSKTIDVLPSTAAHKSAKVCLS